MTLARELYSWPSASRRKFQHIGSFKDNDDDDDDNNDDDDVDDDDDDDDGDIDVDDEAYLF